jgi:hypothetical protein
MPLTVFILAMTFCCLFCVFQLFAEYAQFHALSRNFRQELQEWSRIPVQSESISEMSTAGISQSVVHKPAARAAKNRDRSQTVQPSR